MTGRSCRRIVLIATLAAGSGVLLAGQTPQAQPPDQVPSFRSSIDAVQLTVIVTDAEGRPVAGLTADDFEIFENRLPRPITTFEAIDIPIERRERDLAEPDVLTNERPPGRLYVIALDTMTSYSALRARAFLRQFVERHFGPNDTAAVVLTTRGPRNSGQEFTSNPRLLVDAINKFDGGSDDGDRERSFSSDLRTLMAFMATLRGARKAVIFVTEGVPVDAWQVVNARPARFGGLFSDIDTDFIEALSFATRNNIALYPIDPRGLGIGFTAEDVPPEEAFTRRPETQATLDDRLDMGGLAAVTGGFALIGSNNFEGAFERLVRENSTHYLLGFSSAVEQRDGRYVNLEVRVKRPGLQVRSIDGYVAPRGRPREPRRPPTSAVLATTWDAVASAITTSGVPLRVYAAPFKGKGKEKAATVAITVEVAGSKLNLQEQDGTHRGILEIVFAVTDIKNKRWPIWRHRAELKLRPETYERVSHGAVRAFATPAARGQVSAACVGRRRGSRRQCDLRPRDSRLP